MTSTFQFVKYVRFLNKNKSLMVSYLVSYIHVNVFHIYTIFYVQCYIYYNISFMYFFHFDFFFNCLHTLANFFFFGCFSSGFFLHLPFMDGAELGEIIQITFIFKIKLGAPNSCTFVFQFLDVYNCSLTKMALPLSLHKHNTNLFIIILFYGKN